MTFDVSAAEANKRLYRAASHQEYIQAAPHLRHASLRNLHQGLIESVFRAAARNSTPPASWILEPARGRRPKPF